MAFVIWSASACWMFADLPVMRTLRGSGAGGPVRAGGGEVGARLRPGDWLQSHRQPGRVASPYRTRTARRAPRATHGRALVGPSPPAAPHRFLLVALPLGASLHASDTLVMKGIGTLGLRSRAVLVSQLLNASV